MERAGKRETVGEGNRKSVSPSKDNSLKDFKSPKPAQAVPHKVNIVNDKRAKKSSSKVKTSGNKKKAVGKEVTQPSIESSFFKAAINGKRDGHTCPLCIKYFADTSAGISHTKSCAARNKVSTKKLLAAVALQERQADERVAIGLPAGPIVQPKEKTPRRHREAVAKGDPDLQLALALSKSLQENQLEQDLEEALLLAGQHRGDERIIGFSSDSERTKTLKNFGFLINKPVGVSEGPVRTRRRKHLGPTILQTRSQDTRDRLLTERIAEILMGNEATTQVYQQETTAEVQPVKKPGVTLRSRNLKEIHRTTKRLWDSAQLAKTVTDFYVEDLGPVIVPADIQEQENPVVEANKVEETGQDKKEAALVVSEESSSEDDDKLIEKMSESSQELEQINEAAEDRLKSSSPKNIQITDRQYRNTLPMDWASTLNVSFVSDVVVLVKDGHIWAHKLVFHVRCSDILLDCETNSDMRFSHVKEKISWHDVDLPTGLAFLEFVYSGLIEKNVKVLSDNRVASGVRGLARKYRLKALFDYLRRKQPEFGKSNNVAEKIEARKSGLRSPIVIEVDKTPSEVENIQENLPANLESKDAEENRELSPGRNFDEFSSTETSVLIEKTAEGNLQSRETDAISVISVASSRSRVSMSPDLFDETTEETTVDTVKNSEEFKENHDLSVDNSNLKILADLIAQDDLSLSTDASGRSTASTILQDKVSKESPSANETNDLSSQSQGHVETPRSHSISTVAADAKINDRPRSQLFPAKQKSNMSLFIEKIQKINAKGALDSYTEGESLAEPPGRKRRRNPFNVNDISNSSILDSTEKIKSKRGHRRDERRGLSVFGQQLNLISAVKKKFDDKKPADDANHNARDSNETSRAEESSVVDDTTDDEDTSMYSKYRKTHKQNNSISDYRNRLKELANAAVTSKDDEQTDNLSSLNENAIDLTQDSDTDVDVPPSPMSGPSPSSQRKFIGDASDSNSIESASTVVVHYSNSNVSDDDEELKDAETKKAASAASSSNEDKAKGRDYSEISDEYCEETKDSGDSLTESRSREKTTEEEKTERSVDDLKENQENVPQYSIDTTPESVKSSRNSPRYSERNLLDEDDEIFARSWKSKTISPSPSTDAPPGESATSDRKRKSEEIRAKKNSFSDDLEKDDKAPQYCATGRSSKSAKSPRNSPEYPDLDVFEIDEEMFNEGVKKSCTSQQSFMPTPKRTVDYFNRSASSRRKRRAVERRAKDTSFVDESNTKSPANTSEYPDIDVDDLFTQSLRNTFQVPGRSLTPVGNRSFDSPGKSASYRRKGSSNGDRRKPRESFIDDFEENISDKSSEGAKSPRRASEYHYEVFEPDDNVFTQSFNCSRLSPYRALSPSPNCASPKEDSNQGSTLKVSSPIVISSSPDIDLETERNVSNDEQDCNKENTLAAGRNSLLFSRKSLENLAESISPTNIERPTTPQPGTSRTHSANNRGNLQSSAKSPLVRWKSMPTSSSNSQVNRKRSRTPTKSSRLVMSQNVTPPVNYNSMDTPELKKELEKYGIKPQKRNRARQLLTHIYNELHPVVPVSSLENNLDDNGASSNDDEPPAKKIGAPSTRNSEDTDSDLEEPLSQKSVTSTASVVPEEMDFADGNASSDDSDDSARTSSIKKAFNSLIKEDHEMYNKVLTYEPLPLELVYLMLKARGLKCKCKDLMDFLDEECITFQVQTQRNRSKKTRGKKTAPSGKRKANSLKS